ncbi:terminase [Methylibium sp.]|uniref:terminase n=1 Tax=Methylibium sp. TaxID=2067992 RepID=UPI003BAADACA
MNDAQAILTFRDRPADYVRCVFQAEPDEWQVQALNAIATDQRLAVASGHGVGKTALTSWLIHWFMSTRPDPQIVVTANTKNQLDSKTWRELAKWNQRAINGGWFTHSATRFALKEAPDTWFASAIPWTENNSEAFAGTHEEHVLNVFDEASSIPDVIWDVVEGSMTTANAKWAAFGNPTRNTGRFRECWGRFRHRWHTMQVDSRTAKQADAAQIQAWIDDYGIDSDFVKVRVLGEFPSQSTNQFISAADVDACVKYEALGFEALPKILAADIARFGDDQSVIAKRQGRKVLPFQAWRGLDLMKSADKIAEAIDEYEPDAAVIDETGVGSGVVDRLRQLRYTVFGFNGGEKPNDPNTYRNRRVEVWGLMRDALKERLDLPNDYELRQDLIGPEYGFTPSQQLLLERKEDMKKRGLGSPDKGDALAMTWAVSPRAKRREKAEADYAHAGGWMG